MWSAYVTISVITTLMALTGWPPLVIVIVGVSAAAVNMAAMGFVLQRLIISPLIKRPSLALLIATLGLAIVLEEGMRLLNNSREKWLTPLFTDALVVVADTVYPVQITHMQLGISVLAMILVLILLVTMRRHRFGRFWRACSDDLTMAALCGISVGGVLAATFVLAAVYASLAGSLIALLYGSVNFTMGMMIGLKTLFVAVLGGLQSFRGAVLGAFFLGFFETYWSAYFAIAYRDVAAFAVLLLIFILRPQGLARRA
jgi:branched-chain amino acid transport system permease protein